MSKRYISLPLLFITALVVHAQNKGWTVQDSINLRLILKGNSELKLNPEAMKLIDLGDLVGSPKENTEKPWMLPDETLPDILPDKPAKKKVLLTLFPYNASTKFNWDPVYQKKIKVNENTWKEDPLGHLSSQTVYSNWAKKPMQGGVRKSLEEIEATGLRYNPVGERANNMSVGVWKPTSKPSGIDLMTPFTKKFWDFKGRKRRARTMDVLSTYGDSTATALPDALPKKAKF